MHVETLANDAARQDGGPGDYPGRTFLVHVSTDWASVSTQFHRTPLANTDVIAITIASQCDLRFTATSDTAGALLSASFNAQPVALGPGPAVAFWLAPLLTTPEDARPTRCRAVLAPGSLDAAGRLVV